MAIITVQELAARYRLAARRQALVERFKAAETRFKPGDLVRVKPTHNFKEWHDDVGEVDKFVPFGKYYVELERNGRVIIDGDYLERAEDKKASNASEQVQVESPGHPLHGETVQVVRRDPFKKFIVVRVLRTRGGYRKGEDVRFGPQQIALAPEDKTKKASIRVHASDVTGTLSMDGVAKLSADDAVTELVEKLNKIYAEVDRELKTYSEKANKGEASAKSHYDKALKLQAEARELTQNFTVKKASLDDSFKDAAFAFLRESKFSWLAMGMAEEAKRTGVPFGMRDVAGALKAWFANRKPEGPKEEAGYRYLQGGAGQMLMNRLIRGVQEALQSTGARVGLKDVGEAIVAFAEDR